MIYVKNKTNKCTTSDVSEADNQKLSRREKRKPPKYPEKCEQYKLRYLRNKTGYLSRLMCFLSKVNGAFKGSFISIRNYNSEEHIVPICV